MDKEKLLRTLQDDLYVMLKSSSVHGIGVFAIRDIPEGCKTVFSSGVEEWIKIPIKEVESLPAHARIEIETYCLFDEEYYFVPEYGFKIIDPVIYLNHSSQPNLVSKEDGEVFEALRDIKAGEELFVDYTTLADGLEGYSHPQMLY